MIEHRDSPHIYLIGEGNGSGVVKIGRSEDPRRRLNDIQVSTPHTMQLIHVVLDAGDFEHPLHDEFANLHVSGEWFDFGDQDPVAEVERAIRVIRDRGEALSRSKASTGHGNPCAQFGCSAWSAISVVAGAAQYLLETHPDPAAYLASKGFASHCVESAYPEIVGRDIP